jgi:AraC-like DNA-binding protein
MNTADIKSCVDFNLARVKTISDVAKILKMSSETLRKKFEREEGVSLRGYIFCRKIELMIELLLVENNVHCNWICYTV